MLDPVERFLIASRAIWFYLGSTLAIDSDLHLSAMDDLAGEILSTTHGYWRRWIMSPNLLR